MNGRVKVLKSFYQDSVSLMQIGNNVRKKYNLKNISILMGTETNLQQIYDKGYADEIEATGNDIIIYINAEANIIDEALAFAEKEITSVNDTEVEDEKQSAEPIKSISHAKKLHPDFNVALISIPGAYAASEALKALKENIHVMIFSDNVSIEDERMLKEYGVKNNLLVMGPDCGTAIISGTPLAFANVIPSGDIGIIGASGTGIQEVTAQIAHLNCGITHAIGTGGRDLNDKIGGLTTLTALKFLAEDNKTKIITIISKPTSDEVANIIISEASKINKKIVIVFLGMKRESHGNIYFASTLSEAALFASFLSQGKAIISQEEHLQIDQQKVGKYRAMLSTEQKYIRGIYCGGTLCYETQFILKERGIATSSNAPFDHKSYLKGNDSISTVLDMGDDEFTMGRPHPMIDPTLRNQRIFTEAQDCETAIILFDVVLGYGSALDSIGELMQIVGQAKTNGSKAIFIAYVLGTSHDIQNKEGVIKQLQASGIETMDSNVEAVEYAAAIVGGKL